MGTRLERATRRAYPYPNGSLIVVGGMDKSTRLLSTEYDLIFVQEAIELTESDWETLSTRLRHGQMPYQQLVADTNPDAPSHWIYQRSLLGELRMVSGSHEDNPLLYDPEQAVWTEIGQQYLSMLDKLTGPRYDRMRWGRWVQAEGAVYRDWNPAVHCVDHFPIPSDWRRFRVVDFGYTNPFVCLWIAQDHDGRVYVYRQLYHTERLVADHAKQINALSRLPNGQPERIEATICDHDAEDRATLERAGIRTKPATKDVRMGIQAVQERLRLAGDKKPRLVVLRDSLVERDHRLADVKRPCDLIEEFPGYVWGQPRGGDNPKEVPIKVDDHALDALRYGVMYVDQRAPRQLHVRQIRGLYRSADRQRAVKRGPRT
jgi:PBSX family phage terminase large subunit